MKQFYLLDFSDQVQKKPIPRPGGVPLLAFLAFLLCFGFASQAQDLKPKTKGAKPVSVSQQNQLPKFSAQDEMNPDSPLAQQQTAKKAESFDADANAVYMVFKPNAELDPATAETNPEKVKRYVERLEKKYGEGNISATNKPGVFVVKFDSKQAALQAQNSFSKAYQVSLESKKSLVARLKALNATLTD